MDYFSINSLRENHAGWSLLRAQNAPLALTFFMTAFTDPNQRNLGRQDLIDVLDDGLFSLRDSLGEDRFPLSGSTGAFSPGGTVAACAHVSVRPYPCPM